jgi:catechol 2,3-dioxygenase-like lactoylglutathione lyase family enzyme
LVFVALWVRDLDISVAFYRDALGVPLKEGFNEPASDRWTGGRHSEFSWREGAYLHFALFPVRPDQVPTSGAEVGFFTDDVEQKHRDLVARGVRVIHPPGDVWDGLRTARYEDPEGNIVSFTQRV